MEEPVGQAEGQGPGQRTGLSSHPGRAVSVPQGTRDIVAHVSLPTREKQAPRWGRDEPRSPGTAAGSALPAHRGRMLRGAQARAARAAPGSGLSAPVETRGGRAPRGCSAGAAGPPLLGSWRPGGCEPAASAVTCPRPVRRTHRDHPARRRRPEGPQKPARPFAPLRARRPSGPSRSRSAPARPGGGIAEMAEGRGIEVYLFSYFFARERTLCPRIN